MCLFVIHYKLFYFNKITIFLNVDNIAVLNNIFKLSQVNFDFINTFFFKLD